MEILSPYPELEDRPALLSGNVGKVCASEWECHGPCWSAFGELLHCLPSLRQTRKQAELNRQQVLFYTSKVAVGARMLGLALVPKCLHLEPTTFIFSAGID